MGIRIVHKDGSTTEVPDDIQRIEIDLDDGTVWVERPVRNWYYSDRLGARVLVMGGFDSQPIFAPEISNGINITTLPKPPREKERT